MTKVVQLATRTRQGIMEETTPVHPVVDARRQRHRSRCTGSVISSGQSFSCHLACFRSSHVILLCPVFRCESCELSATLPAVHCNKRKLARHRGSRAGGKLSLPVCDVVLYGATMIIPA
jgi:hypothetical protein